MEPPRLRFAGAVLCGGESRRMGRDKALLELHGLPMAVRVAAVLTDAGARPVVAVGGDQDSLRRLGLAVTPDRHPGRGPAGGVLTALGLDAPCTLVVSCDLLAPSAGAMRTLVAALRAHPEADVVVPVVDGRRQWVHAAWRASAAAELERAVVEGDLSFHRATRRLRLVELASLDPGALADADTPGELPGGGTGCSR
jgi:molybdenum cofactor guanylyltransferase